MASIAKRPASSALSLHDEDGIGPMRALESFANDEDAAPVDMLAALFEARGWPCAARAHEVTGEVRGSWSNYQVKGIWRAEDCVLQILCLPEIRVPKDRLVAAYELLGLINEQLWLGHFDIWSNGGVLLYRNATMLGDEGTLRLAQAQALVEIAVEECDRFYPAFQFVLWGGKSPADALQAALVDAAGEA